MASKGPKTFKGAVVAFENASPWLGAEHMPAVVALREMAKVLDDGELSPALLGQFGLAFRALRKERPVESGESEMAAALRQAQEAG